MNDYYNKEIEDLFYLLKCAIIEKAPESNRVNDMDLQSIYSIASYHSLASMIAFALEKTISLPYEYHQAKTKALRKLALLDIERKKFFDRFNEERIWYLPLKGILLKDYYPKYGMREMSDNDILCDSTRMSDIQRIAESSGYIKEPDANPIHDCYLKSLIAFEFHKALFSEKEEKALADYYSEIKKKLYQNDTSFEYSFTPEDCYIYLIAHEYKHYNYGGTGLRSLVDIYVYLRKWEDKLDREYIDSELNKLKLTEFETLNRTLSRKILEKEPLSDEEQKLLYYIINSGSHGTDENLKNNQISARLSGDDSDSSKRRYILKRVFLSGDDLKEQYPFYYQHKALLPILFFYRLIKALIKRPKAIMQEYQRIKGFKYDD